VTFVSVDFVPSVTYISISIYARKFLFEDEIEGRIRCRRRQSRDTVSEGVTCSRILHSH
jgi:hypothetical protein